MIILEKILVNCERSDRFQMGKIRGIFEHVSYSARCRSVLYREQLAFKEHTFFSESHTSYGLVNIMRPVVVERNLSVALFLGEMLLVSIQ